MIKKVSLAAAIAVGALGVTSSPAAGKITSDTKTEVAQLVDTKTTKLS